MKILPISAALCILFLLAPAIAYACGCSDLSPEIAFERAEIVFVGKVVEAARENLDDKKHRGATFEIDSGLDKYKGSPNREFSLKIPGRTGTDCEQTNLVLGNQYYVYAYADAGELGEFKSKGVCARIAPIESKEDSDFIRRLRERGYGTIKGYVSLVTHTVGISDVPYRVPTVRLSITGPDQDNRELPVDESGNFEITGLRAGTYRIKSQVPVDYESKAEREEITFIGGMPILFTSVSVQYRSRVSGTIQDSRGVAFDQRSVFLENSTTRIPGGRLNSDGGFEMEGVPPGKYVMYMELRSEDMYKTRKFYYPGTYDPQRAAEISVGLSDLKSGMKFTLPPEFRVREVSGTAYWPDGKRAAGVSVFLSFRPGAKKDHFRPEPSRLAVTDKNGRFSVKGISGFSYWLVVGDGTRAFATLVKINLTRDLSGVKVVLPKR